MKPEHDEALVEQALGLFNGGLVNVEDSTNPRGFITFYLLKQAMSEVISLIRTTDAARIKALEAERDVLLTVMDAADRYNGSHSQSRQPMGRLQGNLILAIRRAYRVLGLSRDDLARATLKELKP